MFLQKGLQIYVFRNYEHHILLPAIPHIVPQIDPRFQKDNPSISPQYDLKMFG